jgi:hypothetical protein
MQQTNPSFAEARFDGRRLTALSLFLLTSVGCGGEPGGDATLESSTTAEAGSESIGSLAQDLTFSGVNLPWRGQNPAAWPLQTTNRPGLSIVWRVDIGVSTILEDEDHAYPAIVGMQVCAYEPSNPNNTYTAGDPLGCQIIGKRTASKWHTQQCPINQVVAGYNIATNPGGNSIGKLGMVCRDLANPNFTGSLPVVGNSGILFTERLVCGEFPQPAPVGYVDYFMAKAASVGTLPMLGMGARCVAP